MTTSIVSPSQRGFSHSAIHDLDIAIDLVEGIKYKPGWTISAKRSKDFEQGLNVTFVFPAVDADRSQAPNYNAPLKLLGLPAGFQTASFTVICDGCSEIELYRHVLDTLIRCEIHEAREFFRVGAALDAPFHPHHIAGRNAFGDPVGDLTFGITRG